MCADGPSMLTCLTVRSGMCLVVVVQRLFDQTVIGLQVSGEKYGLSHGNKDGYTMQQRDCENCLRHHQCTPKASVA
jgi:hypothetical protein